MIFVVKRDGASFLVAVMLVTRLITALATTLAMTSCARPPSAIDDQKVLRELAAHYRAFYPEDDDPDLAHDSGLLRPRFGLPAIAKAGASFEIDMLERGGPQALRAALVNSALSDEEGADCANHIRSETGCFPLSLVPLSRETVSDDAAIARFGATPNSIPPAGGYDLLITSAVDCPVRAPRGVWLKVGDPDARGAIRVAHLSDLHIGKNIPHLEERLREVISDVNRLSPDLVVITGDVVNRGERAALPPRARDLLLAIEAPTLIVVGNHDLGFGREPMFGKTYLEGWSNFARTFHPYLHYEVALGGYDFIGFDTGTSIPSSRVLTRGVLPETIDAIGAELDRSWEAHRRGVVLFSHAPSRAGIAADPGSKAEGHWGRMSSGHREFEQLLLDASARGQRVIHLAGHTHWSDLFEAYGSDDDNRFARSPLASLPPCLTPLSARAALITTQAAGLSGIPFKRNARGWGFTFLVLDDDDTKVAFHRYGIGPEGLCPQEQAFRSAH